jgi:hypothetical protein
VIYVYAAIGLVATLAFVLGFIALVNKLAGEVLADPNEQHDDERGPRRHF